MGEKSGKAKIKHPIDPEKVKIERDPLYPTAYIIALPLDSEPSYVWQRLLEARALKLVTTRDRVGEKLGWLEDLVLSTNKRVEEYNKKVKAEKETREAAPPAVEEEIRTELSKWLLTRVPS